MKKLFNFILACGITVAACYGQGSWMSRADLGLAAIGYASSTNFSVAGKGYICCGIQTSETNVLWQYDPVANVWTQKASFPGPARRDAHAFTIGSKAYVGVGHHYSGSYTYYNDLYEYNPATNSWTQKASFPGAGRGQCFEFAIGDKGYIGGGSNTSSGFLTDLWQYDTAANGWTQKAAIPFTCSAGVGFAIGSYGYAGTGSKSGVTYTKDFWQYNPATDSWVQKTSFLGLARYEACGFSMDHFGYIGVGNNASSFFNDIYQYDGNTDTWTQMASLPATGRREAMGFTINNKAYITGGYDGVTWDYLKDTWELTPPWYGIEQKTGDASDLLVVAAPNPVENILNLTFTDKYRSPFTLDIYNQTGSLAYAANQSWSENMNIDVSAWTSGIYYIKIQSGTRIWKGSFIKL